MPSTFTTNTNLELQATGDHSGTWGAVLNTADFQIIDNVLGNVQTISLSSTDVTLTTSQTQVNTLKLTGALTANVNVIFPAIGRTYAVQNATTGNFSVFLKITGSGQVALVPKNGLSAQAFILDGTNVYPVTGIAPGTVNMFAMSTAPAGWIECDGSAISRTTYASLFATIGTTFGSGDGSTTFNIPDARGYFGRAWDHGAGRDSGRAFGTTQTGNIQSHTHTGTTSTIGDHVHTMGAAASAGASNLYPITSNNTSLGTTTTNPAGSHNHTFTTNSTGGTETRPINLALLFAIKT